MTYAAATYLESRSVDAFCVVAPRASDMMAGTLRSAYDDPHELPDIFLRLLDNLDRID